MVESIVEQFGHFGRKKLHHNLRDYLIEAVKNLLHLAGLRLMHLQYLFERLRNRVVLSLELLAYLCLNNFNQLPLSIHKHLERLVGLRRHHRLDGASVTAQLGKLAWAPVASE